MDDNEYLRLPHGMFDRDENWIERERKRFFSKLCG